jgi:ABC-type multidrug transport system ATPase subunit
MIEVERLTKYYGLVPAIFELSFTVGQGEVAGFLGPNETGKTTTPKILTCFLPPTSGQALRLEFPPERGSLSGGFVYQKIAQWSGGLEGTNFSCAGQERF